MPRKRRRIKARISVDWGQLFAQLEAGLPWRRPARGIGRVSTKLAQLVGGHDFFGDAFGEDDRRGSPPFDEELAREFWDVLGEAIVAKHAELEPGTRPWAWWRLEAPEPRRVLSGKVEDERPPWLGSGPIRWPRDYFFGEPKVRSGVAEYETELDYLRRLGLLRRGEAAASESRRHEPQPARESANNGRTPSWAS